MSTHITDFDSKDHKRWFKVEIDYTYQEDEHGCIDEGRLEYRIPGELTVHTVRVLEVEYYNNDGDTIAKIARHGRIKNNWWESLDAEVMEIVMESVENWDDLAEKMAERA